MKHLRILFIALAVLGLAACQPKSTSSSSTSAAVATVNGVPITRDFYDAYIKMVSHGRATPSELTPQQRAMVLDGLIRAETVAQEAVKQGLDKDPLTRAKLELIRLNVLEQALSDKYLAGQAPTDAELQTVYNQQMAKFPKLEYHARHILVKSEAEAKKIIRELDRDHGRNFAALAKADSIDPSKANGGDLGWFPLSNMVPSFSAALAKLKVGQITQAPVHTRFGWHVIQLLGTRPMHAPSFKEVKSRLKQAVENRKFSAYTSSLVKQAKVETFMDTETGTLNAKGKPGMPAVPSTSSVPAGKSAPPAAGSGTPPAGK